MAGQIKVDELVDPAGTGSPTFPNKLREGFYLSPQTISTDFTVPTNFNAMTAGPVAIASGVTVTVSSGSEWTIV